MKPYNKEPRELMRPVLVEPLKTKDCERCPLMTSGWCFKCSMLNFHSPAYFKVTGVQPPRGWEVPPPPPPQVEVRKQPRRKEPVRQPTRFVPPPAPMEPPPQCVQCEKPLSKDEQEILICKECARSARIEQRVHEYRSKTMEKLKSPKTDITKSRAPGPAPVRPAIFDSIGSYMPARLAELRKKY